MKLYFFISRNILLIRKHVVGKSLKFLWQLMKTKDVCNQRPQVEMALMTRRAKLIDGDLKKILT